MREEYNIYCDESCHLEHDNQKAMVLGAIWCSKGIAHEAFVRIREIKEKHGLSRDFEVKWNKVSPAKINFYKELIDYYFDDDDLHFRALVVPDKSILDHNNHNQSHDDFYYKMFFDLLKVIFDPQFSYNIYLDIKDTRSQEKIDHLAQVLRNTHYDYNEEIIKQIQQVRSHEVELIQLTDLLAGAISYINRGLIGSKAKLELIERIKSRSKYSLLGSTLYRESKMNIFIWKGKVKQ